MTDSNLHEAHPLSRVSFGLIPEAKSGALNWNLWLFGGPWAVMAIASTTACLWPNFGSLTPWLFAVSVLLFGLPHGACDLAALWRNGLSRAPRATLAASASYLVLAFATLIIWRFDSALALTAFLALTAWHWGEGDTWAIFPTGWARIIAAIGRGTILMLSPLVLQQNETRIILDNFAGLAGGTAPIWLWKIASVAVFSGVLLQAASCWSLKGQTDNFHRALLWSGLETGLILLFWASVPPLIGVALYLTAVHAWRHLLRLATQGGRDVENYKTIPSRIWRWQCDGLWLGLLSLLMAAVVLAQWPVLSHSVTGWSTTYIVLIAALTTPHALVVAYLGYRHAL